MTTGTLLAIAIKPTSHQPMIDVSEGVVTLDGGLTGDARGRTRRRQITIVAREAWAEACDALGTEVPWTARRANLLVEGFNFENTKGRILQVGPVRLEITGETLPCARMDEAHPGLRQALGPQWRGGVTTKVVSAGAISPGDSVTWDPQART